MTGQVIAFESISGALSSVDSADNDMVMRRDTRFSPSYVDVGTLNARSCQLSARHRLRGSDPFPERYLYEVKLMVKDSVAGVERVEITSSIEGNHNLVFIASDGYNTYSYGFVLWARWFEKN